MAKRILVAVDRTTPPYELLDFVADAAKNGAALRLLHVTPPADSFVDGEGRTVAYADQEAARLEGEARDALSAFEVHVPVDAVESVVRVGAPADEIVREAEEFGADLIAMPVRCHSAVRRLLFGGTAQAVARRAPMAVLLFRLAA
jgi:nucleotide-binding universal stress UspA family protein